LLPHNEAKNPQIMCLVLGLLGRLLSHSLFLSLTHTHIHTHTTLSFSLFLAAKEPGPADNPST